MEKTFITVSRATNIPNYVIFSISIFFIILFCISSIIYSYQVFFEGNKSNIFWLFFDIFFGMVYILAFFLHRDNWFRKIIINDAGIVCFGFLKKDFIRWDEIIDITPCEREIKITTSKGKLGFYGLMKEKNSLYPNLKISDWVWIDADGNEEPFVIKNSPLYLEMKKHWSKA